MGGLRARPKVEPPEPVLDDGFIGSIRADAHLGIMAFVFFSPRSPTDHNCRPLGSSDQEREKRLKRWFGDDNTVSVTKTSGRCECSPGVEEGKETKSSIYLYYKDRQEPVVDRQRDRDGCRNDAKPPPLGGLRPRGAGSTVRAWTGQRMASGWGEVRPGLWGSALALVCVGRPRGYADSRVGVLLRRHRSSSYFSNPVPMTPQVR
jgi:hypothetical protein